MDEKLFLGTVGHNNENGERKYLNGHRDVKRRLSFINKKISDLQRQRKFMYKNSAKIKKIIHNQVNQIVKCLRARERSLWADVDEAYIAQEENISKELSTLLSVHARCQGLLENFDDNKGTADVLDKIYSTLSVVKFGEKQDVKPLEFISDFETMKNMANCFGYLEGDGVKKDEFVFIEKNDNYSGDSVCQEFHDKKGCSENLSKLTVVEPENFQDGCSSNLAESENSFEIVDLLESLCCEEQAKDTVMVEQESSGNCCQQVEFVDYKSENRSKFLKVSNGLENYPKSRKNNDFNPEEEWKQIFEMRNRIANFNGISSKLSEENKNCEIQNTVRSLITDTYYDKNNKKNTYFALKEADTWLCDRSSRKEKLNDKNFIENKFLYLQGADSWLCNRNSENNAMKERNFESINTERNPDSSPAELIRQAFSSYLTKENIHYWLLCN